ncbi:MAG: META domain-containing protein [Haliscomenobacteraceae bacterium CHB4]|nr:META domain-containing protein [Haliscomenobacteraceae bacterium CHB4]
MKKIFFFFVALLVFSSLQSCKTTIGYGKEWELTQLYSEQVPAGTRIMIVFDEANTRYSGTASCNNYNGLFKLEGSSLRLAQPVSTKKMCPDMTWENKYLPVLTKIDAWDVIDGKLQLMSQGSVVAIYK